MRRVPEARKTHELPAANLTEAPPPKTEAAHAYCSFEENNVLNSFGGRKVPKFARIFVSINKDYMQKMSVQF